MSSILICHTDRIIVRGLEAFLSSIGNYQIYTANNYHDCLDSASFLHELGETFVIIAEGKILDSDKCSELVKIDRVKLILCDRPASHNSLLLALNCNSSYIRPLAKVAIANYFDLKKAHNCKYQRLN